MKILMIGCFDLFLHPYSEKYISIFEKNNIDYSFVFWNRKGEEFTNDSYKAFNYKMSQNYSFYEKIKGYLLYRKYVLSILKNEEFDRIVVFTSQAMFLFGNIIRKKYRGKYIFDYRDVTYEKNKFYKKSILKSIEDSSFTVISSPGFKKLFPSIENSKFVLCHNAKNNFGKKNIQKSVSSIKRIAYWGLIRDPQYFKKILEYFGNVEQYEVNIYGIGAVECLNQMIENNMYKNIYLHGEFKQSDIDTFARNTDFLLNCYSNKSIQKLALTVKMYEGIEYGIPMIVQKNSYMSDYLTNKGVKHIPIDFDSKLPNDMKIEPVILGDLDNVISSIIDDNNIFLNLLEKYIRGEN